MSRPASSSEKNKSSVVRARIDENSKERVEAILNKLGLNTSEAIRLFFKQIELRGGLPFSIKLPNEETRQAMKEAKFGEKVEGFESKEELFDDLNI